MKRHQPLIIFPLLAILLSSCALFQRNSMLDSELEKRNESTKEQLAADEKKTILRQQFLNRLNTIRDLIAEKDFTKAEKLLNELKSMEEYNDELDDLLELMSLARKLPLDKTELAIDQQTILNEATVGKRLPKTYNKVLNVTPESDAEAVIELENVLDKPVSMKVTNMPLGELAMQLRDLEGLNVADPVNVIFNDEILKGKTFTANFKNVPLREIFDYISYNLSVDFNIHGNIIWVTKAAAEAKGPRLITKAIQLKQGIIPPVPEGFGVAAAAKSAFETTKEADTDLEAALKAFYTKNTTGGSYTIFPQRNILLVTDTLSNIRKIEKIVELFSKPPFQVLIEAKFIMVSESDLHDVGVEIARANGGKSGEKITPNHQENANISDFFSKLGLLAADNATGVSSMTVSGILGNRSFDVLIRALESKSSTVTLSAPRITTLNNRTARIRKGDKLYYFEEYNLQTVDNGDLGKSTILVPTGKPANLGLGITFDVKASVGTDQKTILLGLKPEIITFLQWEDYTSSKTVTDANKKTTTIQGTEVKLPRTHEQTVAASVAINSGETVILGGMVEIHETVETKKIPFLGDIPILGSLFTHTSRNVEPTNLLIFVTATIINERGEYVIVNR